MATEIITMIYEILDVVFLLVLIFFIGYLKAKIEVVKAIEELLVDELIESGDICKKMEHLKNGK